MNGKRFLAIGKPEDVITTENMKKIYGTDVKVMDIGKE
jgi:iron complex transport system ATP-binding protein